MKYLWQPFGSANWPSAGHIHAGRSLANTARTRSLHLHTMRPIGIPLHAAQPWSGILLSSDTRMPKHHERNLPHWQSSLRRPVGLMAPSVRSAAGRPILQSIRIRSPAPAAADGFPGGGHYPRRVRYRIDHAPDGTGILNQQEGVASGDSSGR